MNRLLESAANYTAHLLCIKLLIPQLSYLCLNAEVLEYPWGGISEEKKPNFLKGFFINNTNIIWETRPFINKIFRTKSRWIALVTAGLLLVSVLFLKLFLWA